MTKKQHAYMSLDTHNKIMAALKAAEEALTHSEPIASHYPEPVKRHKTALEMVKDAQGGMLIDDALGE